MHVPYWIVGVPLLWQASAAAGQATQVPDSFEITDVTANGAGCAPGTVSKNIAEDKLSLTLSFRDYLAEISPSTIPSDARKACQLTISLKVSPGWRFAVASFDYRGFMNLDQGIAAEHKTTYYFQAQDKAGEFSSSKVGPEQNSFLFQQKVALTESIWSPCDAQRSLNIKTAIRVWNVDRIKYPYAAGVMGNDSIDAQFHDQQWKLLWKRCP